jgi:hypothetical protein
MHVRVHNIGKHGPRWHGSHPHPDTLQQLRTEMRCPQRPPTPINPAPSESSQSIDGRGAKTHQLGQSTEDSSIAVLMTLGNGCQHYRRTMGGRRDGCWRSGAQRVPCGCLRRGVVHGDGKCSAGHEGVGLGWQTGKLNVTHGPAALISYSSTSSRKSRVLIEEQDHVVIDQCLSTPANEAARGAVRLQYRGHPN